MKYYAVRKGKTPGVYESWPECEANVKGFPGAEYKSFKTKAEADGYMSGETGAAASNGEKPAAKEMKLPKAPYAFVDGSYNKKTGVAGWGGFLVLADGREVPLSGHTDNPDLTSMHNVAGEIMGCMDAVQAAMKEGLDELTVCYDYSGIEAWATGTWKANKPGTMAYAKFMQAAMSEFKMKVTFRKVVAHTGIPGNERADKMAKEAVGL